MSRNWLADFKYEDGTWLVKKTGHRIPAELSLVNEIFTHGYDELQDRLGSNGHGDIEDDE